MRIPGPGSARRLPLADVVIAVILACEIELEAWLSSAVPGPHRAVTAAAALLFAAPVATRRRWPVASLQACAVVAVIQAPLHGNLLVGTTGTLLPPLILSYSVGRHRRFWPGALAVLSAAALFGWGIWLSRHVPEPNTYGSLAENWASAAALIVLPWLAGLAMTYRSHRADAYRHLAEQLAQTTSEYERLVAQSQRMEICAELDELLAHTIAAIALQAAGARRLMDNPGAVGETREAIAAIEQAGRAALADLRRLVSLMRSDPAGLGDGDPAPDLAKAGPALEKAGPP
jgi:signal transduction histidine kinase